MSKYELRAIILNCLFNFGASLVSLFVSVYLYIYTESLITMTIYSIVQIAFLGLSSIWAVQLFGKSKFTIPYALGLILMSSSVTYSLFGTPLFEMSVNYVYIAAVLIGIGEGFFYFAYSTCNQTVTTLQSRALFLQYNGIFLNVGGIFAPLVADIIIDTSASDIIGYTKILYLIVAIFAIVILISLTINVKPENKDIPLVNALSLKDKPWRDHQLGYIFYGLMNSLYLNLTGLLIFNAAGGGGLYSKVQLGFYFVSIISYRLLSSALSKDRIKKTYIIGTVIKIVSIVVLVLFNNIYAAIFYGVVNSLANVFYDNTHSYISSMIMSNYYSDDIPARCAFREAILAVGRIAGLLIILLFARLFPNNYLLVSVLVLSLAPIVELILYLPYA